MQRFLGSGASARDGFHGYKSDSKLIERKSGNKENEKGSKRANYSARGLSSLKGHVVKVLDSQVKENQVKVCPQNLDI